MNQQVPPHTQAVEYLYSNVYLPSLLNTLAAKYQIHARTPDDVRALTKMAVYLSAMDKQQKLQQATQPKPKTSAFLKEASDNLTKNVTGISDMYRVTVDDNLRRAALLYADLMSQGGGQ
jgi:hypothetical protein